MVSVEARLAPPLNLPRWRRWLAQQDGWLRKFDFMIEVGFGCDFYLPYFKLIPELKFAFSPLDVLRKDRSDLLDANYLKFTQSVDRVASKMIILSLYFE